MVDCLLTILVNQICHLFSTHQTPDSIITRLGFRDYANGDYLTAAKDTTSYRNYQVWGVIVPTEGKNLSNIQIVYSPKLWEVGLTPSKEKCCSEFSREHFEYYYNL